MQPDVPFYRAICDTLKPRSILEIGVGSGRLVPHLCHNSRMTFFYGIDIEPRMIQKAKEKTFLGGCESCEMSFIEADMRHFRISKQCLKRVILLLIILRTYITKKKIMIGNHTKRRLRIGGLRDYMIIWRNLSGKKK